MRIPPLIPVEAVPSDQISTLKGKIWIARLRIDRVAIFRASGSKAFKAEALIAAVAGDLAASAAVIVSAEAVAVALAALAAAAGSEVGAEN